MSDGMGRFRLHDPCLLSTLRQRKMHCAQHLPMRLRLAREDLQFGCLQILQKRRLLCSRRLSMLLWMGRIRLLIANQ